MDNTRHQELLEIATEIFYGLRPKAEKTHTITLKDLIRVKVGVSRLGSSINIEGKEKVLDRLLNLIRENLSIHTIDVRSDYFDDRGKQTWDCGGRVKRAEVLEVVGMIKDLALVKKYTKYQPDMYGAAYLFRAFASSEFKQGRRLEGDNNSCEWRYPLTARLARHLGKGVRGPEKVFLGRLKEVILAIEKDTRPEIKPADAEMLSCTICNNELRIWGLKHRSTARKVVEFFGSYKAQERLDALEQGGRIHALR